MVWAVLGLVICCGTAAADAQPSKENDLLTNVEASDWRSCDDRNSKAGESPEAWIDAAGLRVVAFQRDCRDRLGGELLDACEIGVDDLVLFMNEHGYSCLIGQFDSNAAMRFIVGERLVSRGNLRQGHAFIAQAHDMLFRDEKIADAWSDSWVQWNLVRTVLDKDKTIENARELRLLSRTALRLVSDEFPQRSEIEARRDWTDEVLGKGSYRAQLGRCEQAHTERDWDTAVEACSNAFIIDAGVGQSRTQLLYETALRERIQRNQRQEQGRIAVAVLFTLLLLGVFLVGQGDLFRYLGKPGLAAAAYTYVITVLPSWRRNWLLLARIHEQEGNTQQERDVLLQAAHTWPNNRDVLEQLLRFHSRTGNDKGVRDVVLKLNELGDLSPKQLVSLLDAQRSLGLVEDQLVRELEEKVAAEPRSSLLPLLALAYSQRKRHDEVAREVYESTLELRDPRLHFLVVLAWAELERGNAVQAIEYVELAIASHPTAEAVDCLTEALVQSELEEHILWAEPPAGSTLLLIPALLRIAATRSDLNEAIAERLRTLVQETDDTDEILICSAIMRLLRGQDYHVSLLTAADSINESVAYLKALEAAFEEHARRHPEDGFLWLRLAELNGKLRKHSQAILALDRAQRITETRPLAEQKAVEMAQQLNTVELIDTMSSSLGLQSRTLRRTENGYVELQLGHPSQALTGWWRRLDGCLVRVFLSRVPTPEDVMAFRRALEEAADSAPILGLLVSSARPSAATLEFVMSAMIETPDVQLLPLEERTLRDAVGGFRSKNMLSQLRSQWLLGEDLFDKKDPVMDPAEFYGRGQILRTLVRKGHRGEAFGLFGLRKMGKTSLAHRLRNHMADAVVAMVDLQEVSTASCASLARLLCERAVEDWRAKFPSLEPPELVAIEDDEASMSSLEANLRTLRTAILAVEDISTLFFLIDEIEHMIPHDLGDGREHPGFNQYDAFFRLLRGLHQTDFNDVFSFAVIGANARLCLQGRWGGLDNPIFQYLSEIYIAPLNVNEMNEMVTTLGSGMGLSFSDAALQMVFEHCGGHPMVARQLCSEATKVIGDRRPATIRTETLRTAIDAYLALKKGYFEQVLVSYLSKGQRQLLYAVASEDDGTVTRSELAERTKRAYPRLDEFELDLQSLEQYSLLGRRGDKYRIAMRLLRRYIRVYRLGKEA